MKNNIKYVLCKCAVKGVMFILSSATLSSFLMGCNTTTIPLPTEEIPITTVTPKLTTNVTTIPSPTAKPTVTPIPTPSSIPELPVEEEIMLLGMDDENQVLDLSTFLCVYYTILDSKGNEVEQISLMTNRRPKKGEMEFYDLFEDKLLFNCKFKSAAQENGFIDGWVEGSEFEPLNKNLNTIKIKAIFSLNNLKRVCEEFNIPQANKNSDFINKLAEMDGDALSNVVLTKKEWAKIYIEAINKQFRTNSKSFDETLLISSPTISPTRFTDDMPPIRYLEGKINLDEAYEEKNMGRSL